MVPGQTITATIFRRTAAGAPSAGFGTSDFSVQAFLNGAPVSVTPTITDQGAAGPDAEAYSLQVTLPGTKGIFALRAPAAVGTDLVWPEFEWEITNNDEDSIYAILAVPIVSVASQGGPLGDLSLRVVKDDYAVITFSVTDQSGNPINLSGWSGGQFGVCSQDQTTTTYLQTTGITMTSGGLVTIAIPKTATFYAALARGVSTLPLFWQFVANNGGDSSKPQTLGRGTLTLVREEVSP